VSPLPARPDGDGDQHLRRLEDAWEKVVPHWHDGVGRDFGTRQWTPLRDESRAYLEALRAMMDLLDAAERDTDY
jgi:hypothetical protein